MDNKASPDNKQAVPPLFNFPPQAGENTNERLREIYLNDLDYKSQWFKQSIGLMVLYWL